MTIAGGIRACIDVGSTKICTLVGEMGVGRRLHVLGAGVAASRGVRRGAVTDVGQAAEAIWESVQGAERTSGRSIPAACVGLNGGYPAVSGSAAAVADASLVEAVRTAGPEVEALIPNLLAAGAAVLTEQEWCEGVLLADVGGGTTGIGVFADGRLQHGRVLPVGGEHVTRDVAVVLLMRPEAAEVLKIRHGRAMASAVPADEWVEGASLGHGGRQLVSGLRLAQVIEARAEEILLLIRAELERSGYGGRLPGGVVLCGGTAELPGLADLAQQVFRTAVRVGRPRGTVGLPAGLAGPAYASAAGLLYVAEAIRDQEV